MNLYDLTSDYLQLQQMLEDPEADSDLINDTMDAIEGAIEEKADNYAKLIKNLEGNSYAIEVEIERLKNKKNTLDMAVKRLKDNLKEAMIATDKKKFKTELFSFNIQKNGGALPVIVDVATEELPDDLVIVNEKPDLKAIAAYIEKTGDVTYAHFGERGESLRIK